MALFGKSSYQKTVELFMAHWEEVNSKLGEEGPLVVRLDDGSTINLPALSLKRDEIKRSLAELQQRINESTLASQTLNLAKRAILFRARSLAAVMESKALRQSDAPPLPKLPEIHSSRKPFLASLQAHADRWLQLNEPPGRPLLLPGSYAFSDFREEMANLETVWSEADTAQLLQDIAQEEREVILLSVPKILIQYKQQIRGNFPADSKPVLGLPKLYLSPGHSPLPVLASGTWDLEKEMGKITWEPSSEKEPFRYEIRYAPGEVYNEEVESTIISVARTAPALWLTLEGLREKGRTALFRVYVVLPSGDETGSNIVSIINGADDE